MSYEMYRYVFLGSAVACGVLLAVSVVLFFTLRIPKVISDLSGRTAKRAIETIRMQNEQSGNKTYHSSSVNLKRGKLTDRMTESGRLIPSSDTPFGTGKITEKISASSLAEEPSGETTVLQAAEETTILTPEMTQTDAFAPAEFVVETDIVFIHTDEVIGQEANS